MNGTKPVNWGIIGPGTIAQAHKPDEHIPVAEYLAAIGHLIQFIHAWCNSPAEGHRT